jgi:hypothetical protein
LICDIFSNDFEEFEFEFEFEENFSHNYVNSNAIMSSIVIAHCRSKLRINVSCARGSLGSL